jgi:predicted enzyme related to lactoylglutathione lyase
MTLKKTGDNRMPGHSVTALKAHLAIHVRDIEQSIAFYRKMFGLEPSKVRKGYAKFDVQNPPLNFTLNEATFAGAGALSHMGIQLSTTSDVLAMREKWAGTKCKPTVAMPCRTKPGCATLMGTNGRRSSCCKTICRKRPLRNLLPVALRDAALEKNL